MTIFNIINCKEISHVAKLCLSEAVGTALLMIFSCLGTTDVNMSLVEQSLSVGFTVTTVILAIGHISGAHINPSVTVAAVISGALPLYLAPYYIVSQLLGSALGSAIYPQFSPNNPLPRTSCMCLPVGNVSPLQALMIEISTTSTLILVCCASWDPKNPPNSDTSAIKFGILVTMVKLTTMSLTGGSMNPAAAMGPALWNNYWDYHWIYWVGPLAGSIVTSSLYRLIYLQTPNEELPK